MQATKIGKIPVLYMEFLYGWQVCVSDKKSYTERGAHQWEILVFLGKFQPSSNYGLGCGPITEIEKKITTCASVNAIRGTISIEL